MMPSLFRKLNILSQLSGLQFNNNVIVIWILEFPLYQGPANPDHHHDNYHDHHHDHHGTVIWILECPPYQGWDQGADQVEAPGGGRSLQDPN